MGLTMGEENNVHDEEGIIKCEVDNIECAKYVACICLPPQCAFTLILCQACFS